MRLSSGLRGAHTGDTVMVYSNLDDIYNDTTSVPMNKVYKFSQKSNITKFDLIYR